MNKNYSRYKYTVNGRDGFDLTTALRLWKTKYETDFRDFEREVITHPALNDFRDFAKEMWNDIEPVTVEEALKLLNSEERRTYFDAIGVEKLFKQLNTKLLDKQVVKKKRTRWDDNNDKYEYEFEDVYELHEIPGEVLFGLDRWGNKPRPVYAVRCWCTTTNREYWLYVPNNAALGDHFWDEERRKADAIRAIAWTIRLDVDKPERIYRQGDIIVVKYNPSEVNNTMEYHLTKDQYLELMYSET